MARREVKVYECDRCGSDQGERYIVTFPDGRVRVMDRCRKHNSKMEALRDERGEWVKKPTRDTYKVTPLKEIREQLR